MRRRFSGFPAIQQGQIGFINARTIAEGIETIEEYETCRDLGIDLMQGYYLAHPQEQLRLGDAEVAQMIGRRRQSAVW